MRGTFLLPIDRRDPPAIAVVEQLNAVDPARERFGIIYIVARFVRAPDMRDMPELFGAPPNFFFEKSVLSKIRFHARDETIYVQHLRLEIVIRSRLCGRD